MSCGCNNGAPFNARPGHGHGHGHGRDLDLDPLNLGPLEECEDGKPGIYGKTSLGPGLTLIACPFTPGAQTEAPGAVSLSVKQIPLGQTAVAAMATAGDILGQVDVAGIGGSVTTCRPYKCKVSADGQTMICTRRCTTIKANAATEAMGFRPGDLVTVDDGMLRAASAGAGCRWVCKTVNDELIICDRVCERPKARPPVIDPF